MMLDDLKYDVSIVGCGFCALKLIRPNERVEIFPPFPPTNPHWTIYHVRYTNGGPRSGNVIGEWHGLDKFTAQCVLYHLLNNEVEEEALLG